MTTKPETLSIRLTSRRAPYTRAGFRFASTRTPIELTRDAVTTEQLIRLAADPAIVIELFDPKTEQVVDNSAELVAELTQPASADAPPAPAPATTEGQTPPPAPKPARAPKTPKAKAAPAPETPKAAD